MHKVAEYFSRNTMDILPFPQMNCSELSSRSLFDWRLVWFVEVRWGEWVQSAENTCFYHPLGRIAKCLPLKSGHISKIVPQRLCLGNCIWELITFWFPVFQSCNSNSGVSCGVPQPPQLSLLNSSDVCNKSLTLCAVVLIGTTHTSSGLFPSEHSGLWWS